MLPFLDIPFEEWGLGSALWEVGRWGWDGFLISVEVEKKRGEGEGGIYRWDIKMWNWLVCMRACITFMHGLTR
jgi:hypothetical protein